MQRGAGGIFSGILEAPLTLTTKYGAGVLFSPRISAAYEAPLYPELTIGARVGVVTTLFGIVPAIRALSTVPP